MALLYRDITKPHLWPVDDLEAARKECRQLLGSSRITDEKHTEATQQLAEIEGQLIIKKSRKRA